MYNSLRTQNNILVCYFFGWRGQVEINDPPWPRAWVDIEFRPQRKKGIWSSTAGFVSEGLESKRVGRRKEEEEEHKYGLLSSRPSRQRWKKKEPGDGCSKNIHAGGLSVALRCCSVLSEKRGCIILYYSFLILYILPSKLYRERERDLLIFLFEQARKSSNDWSALTHSIPTRTCHPLVRSALRQRYYLPVLGRNHHNHKLVKSRRHWAKSRAINQSHSLACVP